MTKSKIFRSAAILGAVVIIGAAALATENDMLNVVKLVLAGDTTLLIWTPSTLTLIGCT